MKKALQYLLGRLREPSTWAGLAVVAGALNANPDHVRAAVDLGPVLAAAAAAVFLPESRPAAAQ